MGRPDVSADAIVDFDHHSDDYTATRLGINADLRSRCPVAWNENYGGFWFVIRLRRRRGGRARRRDLRAQVRPRRLRRGELSGRDGRPATGRPTTTWHRRGRRPLPPRLAACAHPVLLHRRRREDAPVHGAIGALVSRPADRRRTDGSGARLRQPGSRDPHDAVDGPAVRQLAALRQPLPLGDGAPAATITRRRSQRCPRCSTGCARSSRPAEPNRATT